MTLAVDRAVKPQHKQKQITECHVCHSVVMSSRLPRKIEKSGEDNIDENENTHTEKPVQNAHDTKTELPNAFLTQLVGHPRTEITLRLRTDLSVPIKYSSR